MNISTTQRFNFLNIIEILGVSIALLLAVFFQITQHELPCPLCLLQRVGLIGVCIGLLCNLRFGASTQHYAMTLLSALFTSLVALRQIALHVIPGSSTYGNAFFGLHLYTWSFILSICILVYTSIILGFTTQYQNKKEQVKSPGILTRLCFLLVGIIITANVISTYMECGLKQCPENPNTYIN